MSRAMYGLAEDALVSPGRPTVSAVVTRGLHARSERWTMAGRS